METWYLIIAFYNGSVHHVEFADKKQCELVAQITKEEFSRLTKYTIAYCVKDRT